MSHRNSMSGCGRSSEGGRQRGALGSLDSNQPNAAKERRRSMMKRYKNKQKINPAIYTDVRRDTVDLADEMVQEAPAFMPAPIAEAHGRVASNAEAKKLQMTVPKRSTTPPCRRRAMSMVQRDTSTADIYAKQDNPYVDDPSVLDRGITQDKRKKERRGSVPSRSVTSSGQVQRYDLKAVSQQQQLLKQQRETQANMDRLKAKQKNMDKQASQILRQQRQLQTDKTASEARKAELAAVQANQAKEEEQLRASKDQLEQREAELETMRCNLSNREATLSCAQRDLEAEKMHLRDVDEKQKETRQQIDDRDVSSTVRAKSIDEMEAQHKLKHATLTGHEEKIRERELAYRKREEVLAQEEARLEHRQEQTESRELALQQRDTAAEEADAAFKLREKKNREQEANMQRLQTQVMGLQNEAQSRFEQVATQEETLQRQLEEMAAKDREQHARSAKLNSFEIRLRSKEAELGVREDKVILLERDATEKGRLAEETQAAIAKREADVADARRTLREETKIVDEKQEDLRAQTLKKEQKMKLERVGLDESREELEETEQALDERNTHLALEEERVAKLKRETETLQQELESCAEQLGVQDNKVKAEKARNASTTAEFESIRSALDRRVSQVEGGETRLKARWEELNVWDVHIAAELKQAERWGKMDEDRYWDQEQ